jgi:hypothetical protein
MAKDITPAPARSISAAISTKGEVGPPVSGRLPPAAEAADDAPLLAVAVAVAVPEEVAVEVAVGDEVAVAVVGPVIVRAYVPERLGGIG